MSSVNCLILIEEKWIRAEARIRAGRKVEPSVGIAETQLVKTAGPAQESTSDVGELVLGRKRHVVVDSLRLLMVFVPSANCSDQAGLKLLSHRMARRFTNKCQAIAHQFHRQRPLFKHPLCGGDPGECFFHFPSCPSAIA